MKAQIITLTTILILIATVSATNVYPGETIIVSNDMGIENLVYTIVGNSTNINPIIVEVNSTNISITFPQDMIPDSFDIIFLEEQTKTVVQTVNVGGGGDGGTRTIYKDKIITRDNNIIKEVIGEPIIQMEEIEVEKVVNKIPSWMAFIFILTWMILILFITYYYLI